MILDKWIKGYIEENDNRGVSIPKGGRTQDYLKRFEDIKTPHIGMYCKEPYIILDIDGCDKSENGYGNLDNANVARELIKKYCNNAILITTTHGGVNAIFKRPKRKTYKQSEFTSYGGFCVEYKPSSGKVTIQRDFKVRDIEIIGNPQGEDVDELPLWLRPFENLDWTNDYKGSIANGKEDAGYNIDNFMHKLASYSKLSQDDKKYIVNFINNNVLSNKIAIDKFVEQSNKSVTNNDGEDTIGKICGELLSEYKIIKSNNNLYYYNGETYKDFTDIARKYISLYSPDKRNTFKRDCITNITDMLDNWKLHEYDKDNSRYGVDLYEWIATKSELFNPVTLERKPFTEDLFLRKQLSFDIPNESKPNMVDEIVNKLLLGNELDIKLWWEYQGYLLFRTINFEKMLTLNGSGNNGKSVLLDLATYALQGTCDQYAFKNLFAKFGGLSLENNYFVYAHEMTSDYIKDSTNFKEVVSNNTRQVEPKGKEYITIENYNCKFIYANNGVTKMDTSSAEAVARRQLPLMFEYQLQDDEKDPNFYDKWLTPQNAERYLYLSVRHGQNLLKRGHFLLSERSQKAINDYLADLDNVKQWLDEYENVEQIVSKDKLYKDYVMWCYSNKCDACKNRMFGKRLMKYKPYTTTKVTLSDGSRVNAYNFANS